MLHRVDEFTNAQSQLATARPFISVLVPFFKDDPTVLLAQLNKSQPDNLEILVLDDGAPDPALTDKVEQFIQSLNHPARLLIARTNLGRSAARNTLARHAKGEWLLFLDADMTPTPMFMTSWVSALKVTEYDGLFGGFSVPDNPLPKYKLHAQLARTSDGLNAKARTNHGIQTVCSSNICVKSSAFQTTLFDETFQGWGWEDTCWAYSFAQNYTIGHIDNPAEHAGLNTVEELLEKYAQSGPNFARLLETHPAYATRKGARLALILKNWQIGSIARWFGITLTKMTVLPISLRILALKLYRAGIAAKAIT